MKIVQDKGIVGKVVVVTGATGVLCSCMCEDFLKHGAKVALLGHSLGKAQDLAKKFTRTPYRPEKEGSCREAHRA